MEVFYYSEGDNVIHSRFWMSSGGWGNSGVDKAIQAAPGTHIEGISRESSHMEIFYVGTNGNRMHSYTTNSGSNWVIDQDFVDGAWEADKQGFRRSYQK
ncbi:hypothetical protein TsFJ059_009231 [Trichoderma semiorbis]|uniref:Fucose-specific lectin n=1 Tax=Trichoderma semiorbis TaxID=1491008 RepID=A0A9P8KR66_9HYPO|nr:hypothetical protein TsFJ059_009231 [Trichoderma semiorbis]